MKNISCVNSVYKCDRCNLKGFFCHTPCGADYETCPCCGKFDFLNNADSTTYDFLSDAEFENDMRNIFRYCDNCHIIYQLGCIHFEGGCTDNVFNGHFIQKWKDKVSNIEYEGMPMFDDVDDWFNNVNNVEVKKMHCPHFSNKCKKTRVGTKGYCVFYKS